MLKEKIFPLIDHTKLTPTTTWEEISKLCEEAINYQTASVCIPPSYVEKVSEAYGDKLTICTVIGFPLGYSTTATKVFEAKNAVENGADEIDMVINITDMKNGNLNKIKSEIQQLKEVIGDKILKVIVENSYLTEDEKRQICHIVLEANADFIKTSTGFATGGATKEDIELFKQEIDGKLKMKAAGGINSLEDLYMFIDLGCQRIGTSKAINLLTNQEVEKESY